MSAVVPFIYPTPLRFALFYSPNEKDLGQPAERLLRADDLYRRAIRSGRPFAFAAIRVNPHGGMKHLPIDVRPDIDRRGHRFGLVR